MSDGRHWTTEHADRAIGLWGWVLTSLVQVYDGDRKTMWERVPNAMVSAARQTTRLAAWMTLCLRLLQIPSPGSPLAAASTAAAVESLQSEVRTWPPDPAASERRALRHLCDETSAIVAEAMTQWDAIKASRRKP